MKHLLKGVCAPASKSLIVDRLSFLTANTFRFVSISGIIHGLLSGDNSWTMLLTLTCQPRLLHPVEEVILQLRRFVIRSMGD